MIVKVIDDKFKYITVDTPDGPITQGIPLGKKIICKLEIDRIHTFKQVLTKKNTIAKKRCILHTDEGWILVNHSFDELMDFKKSNNKRIIVKGFKK